MNQREVDILFWDQVADDWAELAAKPIILSEPLDDRIMRNVAGIVIRKGRLRDSAVGFIHRKYAEKWDLEPQEVDQLLEMQVEADFQPLAEELPYPTASQLRQT